MSVTFLPQGIICFSIIGDTKTKKESCFLLKEFCKSSSISIDYAFIVRHQEKHSSAKNVIVLKMQILRITEISTKIRSVIYIQRYQLVYLYATCSVSRKNILYTIKLNIAQGHESVDCSLQSKQKGRFPQEAT